MDRIVERPRLRETLAEIVAMHKQGIYDLPEVEEKETQAVQRNLTPWERVQLSRDKARPVGAEYIEELFTDFMEFHGDRYYQDDKAIIGGIARFHGMPVTVIAQAKGRTTKENIERNFGMPSPEGYRKALRLMKQAEKFQRPVICFVDTPGAFCGMEAEERGQGEAIARNLFEMSASSGSDPVSCDRRRWKRGELLRWQLQMKCGFLKIRFTPFFRRKDLQVSCRRTGDSGAGKLQSGNIYRSDRSDG